MWSRPRLRRLSGLRWLSGKSSNQCCSIPFPLRSETPCAHAWGVLLFGRWHRGLASPETRGRARQRQRGGTNAPPIPLRSPCALPAISLIGCTDYSCPCVYGGLPLKKNLEQRGNREIHEERLPYPTTRGPTCLEPIRGSPGGWKGDRRGMEGEAEAELLALRGEPWG